MTPKARAARSVAPTSAGVVVARGREEAQRARRVELERGRGRRLAQPVHAVEDEDDVPDAAVGRPDRPGPGAQRSQRSDRHPGPADDDERREPPGHGGGPPSPRQVACQHGQQGERREDDEPLEQLDVEREPHDRAGGDDRPRAARLRAPDDEPGGRHVEGHHRRVHRVAARGEDGDRQDRQGGRRGQPGASGRRAGAPGRRAATTASDPRERLGQARRDRAEAEQLDARHLQPQVDRGLVDRDAGRRARRRRRRSCATTAPCCARRRRRTGWAGRAPNDARRSAAATTVMAASAAPVPTRARAVAGAPGRAEG